jgi:hypothetical protein
MGVAQRFKLPVQSTSDSRMNSPAGLRAVTCQNTFVKDKRKTPGRRTSARGAAPRCLHLKSDGTTVNRCRISLHIVDLSMVARK